MICIKESKECCGCNACVQRCPKQCIFLQEDSEGFLYPEVEISMCIDCGLCEQVCPVINQADPRQPLEVYAAKNPDEEIRVQSSSGGIFTMLAEWTIDNGGVVFGAAFDKNWEVEHLSVETKEELVAFRGSKYVQSRIGDTFRQAEVFLKQGREVLFSGTPCQIAGLKLFLRKEYLNLLTVDVICHGVPSPGVWRTYLKEEIMRPKGAVGKNTVLSSLNDIPVITGISFRDKRLGWKKYGFEIRTAAPEEAAENSVLKSDRSNNRFQMHRDNVFMRGFLSNIYLRPSCYFCPAKNCKSQSDITLGDYWGVYKFHRDIDDDLGTSAVLINTLKGKEFYSGINSFKVLSSYRNVLANNPSLEHSVAIPKCRDYFYNNFFGHIIDAISEAVAKNRPILIMRVYYFIKGVIKSILTKVI